MPNQSQHNRGRNVKRRIERAPQPGGVTSSSATSTGPETETKEAPDKPVEQIEQEPIETKVLPTEEPTPSKQSTISETSSATDPGYHYVGDVRVLHLGAPTNIKGVVEQNMVTVMEETWRERRLPGTTRLGTQLAFHKGARVPLSTVQRVE